MPQITIGKGLAFYEEAQALPGVKRVAGMVKQDIELVTGVSPAGITSGQGSGCAVLYGTIGHSPMLDALEAAPHRCNYDGLTPVPAVDGRYCFAPVTHKVTLGEIVDLLEQFHAQPATLVVPEIPAGSFAKKLYSTYLSYLPKERIAFPLKVNADERGSFTELLKTENCGQFSVNISKPGITKGQHWHNTKWEFFIVVSGHGLIQERKVGSGEVMEFEVWGDKPTAVQMLPGCTHNIINLSDTENLVTLMWANEPFDPAKPDTFFLKV